MWFFNSPEVIFGEDALSYLDVLPGKRAFIVTDPILHKLGFTERVAAHLRTAGLEVDCFTEVEPEPSLQTVQRGARIRDLAGGDRRGDRTDNESRWLAGRGPAARR